MRWILFGLTAMLFTACSRPKEVPDDELALIFRDAFLSNAYINRTGLNVDSLMIYEPIFNKYGYTTNDIQYTIGSFSKRKSARLSDVVEAAIKYLDDQGAWYDREIAILDTIDNVSQRMLERVVFTDTMVRVRQLRDTSRLRFVVKDIEPGSYDIMVRYQVDTSDKNSYMRGGVWFDRPDRRRDDFRTYAIRRDKEETYRRRLSADTADHRLIIDFAGFPKAAKKPSITIKEVKVTYQLPAPKAIDSLYRREMQLRTFADEFFGYEPPKDSL